MTERPAAVQARASAKLRAAGVASPQADARTLLMHATGLSATGLLTAGDVDESALARYEQLVAERCAGTPVQHLTGRVWFRNVELAVGAGVFVPRPETELVAGAAIEAARSTTSPLVVELCAGSGAISAALADEVPGVRLFAVEVDATAVRWLRGHHPRHQHAGESGNSGSVGPDQLIQKAPCNGASAQRLPDSGTLISRSDVTWPQNPVGSPTTRDRSRETN